MTNDEFLMTTDRLVISRAGQYRSSGSGALVTRNSIFLKSNECKVGRIATSDFSDGVSEICYDIEMFHGQNGYASEALKAVTQKKFEQDKLPKLVIKKENLWSQRVAIKSGYVPAGELFDERVEFVPCGIGSDIETKRLVIEK